MWATIQGKHLTIKIDLDRYIPSPDPFFSIFTIGDHLLVGACWKGKLEGDESDVYRVFENLLTACYYFLQPEHPHVQKLTRFEKKNVEEAGFRLKGEEVVVYQGVERNSIYYACSTGKTARIYYHNGLLEFTDCPEYKGKHKGVVELPLREFIEDVLKVSKEYLEKYAPIIEKIRLEHGEKPDDYDFLQKFYLEVERLYKEKFG
ncbi:hypothetical protein, conserved [Thermococcus kodakarensis KOD1]|uniref:Uncharacterized protein n=1 Tax=Thermococcus kodakarensis (strain ATCC BAA-918 / JCM 12380 / KOD1) TaxID=69014 RepID=Q5JD75_THEKO|nr:hypothetical protein [Thermococcus kodakarensis]WCN28542.1 hypothetical protein POG15_02475 [Thermococcus kodakarensis]WCN30839.1 hypothetical protein POG21_02475 [Thermococcus kodakarensis]BAD84672.1 hypothetical protein, conserved [Thermococcus kodakarensis KOD1]